MLYFAGIISFITICLLVTNMISKAHLHAENFKVASQEETFTDSKESVETNKKQKKKILKNI